MSGTPRSLSEIASEIRKEWYPVHFAAKPYLEAMMSLHKISDNYWQDSGENIVIYFLLNARTWEGEAARRIKKELNAMLKARS